MRDRTERMGWERPLLALGLGLAALKLVQTVTNFGRVARAPVPVDVPAPDSDEFVRSVAMVLGVSIQAGGVLEWLDDGDGFFPRLEADISAARDSIEIMTYIWRPGAVSTRLVDLLTERAADGVQVRVLVDGIGSLFAPLKKFRQLRRAGGQVKFFAPITSRHLLHVLRRNHARAFVIDGSVGYTGGITVGDQWRGRAQDSDHWRDIMVRGTGSFARTLQEHFATVWAAVTGELLTAGKAPPEVESTTPSIPRHIGLLHAASNVVQPLRYLYWYTLMSARKRVYVWNAYFAPDRPLRRLLCQKARAGLDVRILLPGPHIDNFAVRWSAHYMYQELIDAGVRIFEYRATMMHARAVVVDGVWVLVGSANLDNRSIMLNHENMLGIQDRDLGAKVDAMFLADLARAREIKNHKWIRRPALLRVRAAVASILRAHY